MGASCAAWCAPPDASFQLHMPRDITAAVLGTKGGFVLKVQILLLQVGISMVGASSLLSSGDSSSSQASGAGMVLLGMGLIVFAQACAPSLPRSPPCLCCCLTGGHVHYLLH